MRRIDKHIKTLYQRDNTDLGKSQHETWSLVEIDGELRVLFEAHDCQLPNTGEPIASRLMTIREALREPQSIALKIWLALQD